MWKRNCLCLCFAGRRNVCHFVLSCPPACLSVTITPALRSPAAPGMPHAVSGAERADRAPAGRPSVRPGRGPRAPALARQPPLPPAVRLPAARPLRPVADPHGPPRRPDARAPPLALVGPPRGRRRQLLGG